MQILYRQRELRHSALSESLDFLLRVRQSINKGKYGRIRQNNLTKPHKNIILTINNFFFIYIQVGSNYKIIYNCVNNNSNNIKLDLALIQFQAIPKLNSFSVVR